MTDTPAPDANKLPEAPSERGPLTTDQIMPTCMIYAMFGGLGLLLLTMFGWMLGTALHLPHLF
ncbi:MAG TPA: hypothetical protein VKY74_20165 [Chloroflexia bacterium]|nr:hypothetical protein [Chloroflexia bacterium]